jgi:hypothetical protein
MVKDGYVSHPQGSCHACASESLREQFSSSTVVGNLEVVVAAVVVVVVLQ